MPQLYSIFENFWVARGDRDQIHCSTWSWTSRCTPSKQRCCLGVHNCMRKLLQNSVYPRDIILTLTAAWKHTLETWFGRPDLSTQDDSWGSRWMASSYRATLGEPSPDGGTYGCIGEICETSPTLWLQMVSLHGVSRDGTTRVFGIIRQQFPEFLRFVIRGWYIRASTQDNQSWPWTIWCRWSPRGKISFSSPCACQSQGR